MAKKTRDAIEPKPVRWVGSSKEDLRAFPKEVRRRVGGALWDAQIGLKAPFVKPLKGFRGAGVLEVVEGFAGNAYRAVYSVRFPGVVYVLHAFHKKSRRGAATPQADMALIYRRLARAEEDYRKWQGSRAWR